MRDPITQNTKSLHSSNTVFDWWLSGALPAQMTPSLERWRTKRTVARPCRQLEACWQKVCRPLSDQRTEAHTSVLGHGAWSAWRTAWRSWSLFCHCSCRLVDAGVSTLYQCPFIEIFLDTVCALSKTSRPLRPLFGYTLPASQTTLTILRPQVWARHFRPSISCIPGYAERSELSLSLVLFLLSLCGLQHARHDKMKCLWLVVACPNVSHQQ